MVCLIDVGNAGAAPVNDDFAQRLHLQLGSTDVRNNTGATIEGEERLTENDPHGLGCDEAGNAEAGGVRIESSLWWSFVGNGAPITVSTLGSDFDTVLAVYEVPAGAMVGCNDDIQPLDRAREEFGAQVASALEFQSVAGREYAVQAGGCLGVCEGSENKGIIALRISPSPANDNRSNALTIPAGATVSSSSYGATLEPGEAVACGPSLYANTVWFRFQAPAVGTAVFLSSGFDTVMTIFRGGSTTPIACNDDSIKHQNGPSQIPPIDPAGPPLEVTPGEYLVQVGGFYETGFPSLSAGAGALEVGVQFDEDTDLDNDGVDRNHDCNDADPHVGPGMPEVPNNQVDENCDGVLAYDRDGDGVLAPPAGDDCDDGRVAVHPGAREVPGNRLDENCDGIVAPRPLLASSIGVTLTASATTTNLDALYVTHAPAGGRVETICDGASCPFHRHSRRLGRSYDRLELIEAELHLAVGARLEVLVTKPGWIGRGRSLVMRSKAEPRSHFFCIGPHAVRRRCPRP